MRFFGCDQYMLCVYDGHGFRRSAYCFVSTNIPVYELSIKIDHHGDRNGLITLIFYHCHVMMIEAES